MKLKYLSRLFACFTWEFFLLSFHFFRFEGSLWHLPNTKMIKIKVRLDLSFKFFKTQFQSVGTMVAVIKWASWNYRTLKGFSQNRTLSLFDISTHFRPGRWMVVVNRMLEGFSQIPTGSNWWLDIITSSKTAIVCGYLIASSMFWWMALPLTGYWMDFH